MKKSKFSREQIAFSRRQPEGGISVGETCRKMGISNATLSNRKKRCSGLGVSVPLERRSRDPKYVEIIRNHWINGTGDTR